MDIRLIRGRSHPLWGWTLALVAVAALAYLASAWLGDPTSRPGRAAGAAANFGAERGAVIPVRPAAFESAFPLRDRELGRLLRVRGTAESNLRSGALWVRTTAGRWVLMRFEPLPTDGSVGPFYRGSTVDVLGYLEKISQAEFDAWLDTLAVYLPRPRPGVKFGDLPDSGFVAVDTLFIRNYYISVRPEGARRSGSVAATAADTPRRQAPAPPPPAARRRSPQPEPEPVDPSRVRPRDVRPWAPADTPARTAEARDTAAAPPP